MKNSVIYIVGATVLVGGAYLFLKNKKAKDLAELDKLGGTTTGGTTTGGTTSGGATSGGTTSGGTTSGGTTSGGATPPLTEPVKVDKDLNLDAYNLQKVLEELKKMDDYIQTATYKQAWSGQIVKMFTNQTQIDKARQPILEKLAKLGYKFDNGMLIKI